MKAPEIVYMVMETKADGAQSMDSFEFRTKEEAAERLDYLAKRSSIGSSVEIETVTWLHEI